MEKLAGFTVTHTVQALIRVQRYTPRGRSEPYTEVPATFYRLHEDGAADTIVREFELDGHHVITVGTTDWDHNQPSIAGDVASALAVEFIADASAWERKYGI